MEDHEEVEETGTTTPIIAKVAYDVCPNIEGTQSVVPVGMFMDSVKGCFVPEVQATPVVQTPIKTSPTIVYKDIEMAVVANVSSRNESEYGADTKITVVYRYTKPSNIAACDYDTELKNVATGEVFKGDCSGGYITSRNYLTPGSYKFEIYSPMYNLRQTKEFNVQ